MPLHLFLFCAGAWQVGALFLDALYSAYISPEFAGNGAVASQTKGKVD